MGHAAWGMGHGCGQGHGQRGMEAPSFPFLSLDRRHCNWSQDGKDAVWSASLQMANSAIGRWLLRSNRDERAVTCPSLKSPVQPSQLARQLVQEIKQRMTHRVLGDWCNDSQSVSLVPASFERRVWVIDPPGPQTKMHRHRHRHKHEPTNKTAISHHRPSDESHDTSAHQRRIPPKSGYERRQFARSIAQSIVQYSHKHMLLSF